MAWIRDCILPGHPWTAVLVIAAMALIGGCNSPPPAPTPPPAVTVAQPISQQVTNYLEFTGSTAPIDAVTLVARVEGYLEQIHFTDGAQVNKGDLLFTIQQDQYKAQLQQAKAQVAAEMAAVTHAETELLRYKALVKEDSAPQTQVDRWEYERDSSLAALHSAEAQVDLAQLNLSYTEIRAPFDGRIGRHLIDVGNVVGGVGQPSNLAEIDKIDPLYVYFTINERDLLHIIEQQKQTPHAPLPHAPIPASFGLLNEKSYPHEGQLDFASLNVAPKTGTLQVRGIFPNPAPSIPPGLFVRIRVPAGKPVDAILIPGDAIGFDQQGEYVLVVNESDVVERRPIKTGEQVGDRFVVKSGVQMGESIIVEGLARAVPGRKVAPERNPVATPMPAGPTPAS